MRKDASHLYQSPRHIIPYLGSGDINKQQNLGSREDSIEVRASCTSLEWSHYGRPVLHPLQRLPHSVWRYSSQPLPKTFAVLRKHKFWP